MTKTESGFTLLEVLVSLAILGVSISVLLAGFSNGVTRLVTIDAQTTARAHAQSLLATAGEAFALQDGEASGAFGDGFQWHLRVAPYGDTADTEAWSLRARQVTVTVSWEAQSVRLTTLRLLPAEAP